MNKGRSRAKLTLLPVHAPEDDPAQAAKAAGLRYVSDARPGIRRRRAGKAWSFLGVDGRPIHDAAVVKRIKSLAIPPAWTDVWICPLENGHLQATGRDARGRKQYRYHPRWREVRDETKYERTIAFGLALPKIRAKTEEHLKLPGLPREKVLATVVRLLEMTNIRVGNEEYARTNDSYGLTTMREHHVEVEGSTIHFEFRGKSGKEHAIDVRDRRVASIVKKCQALPGQELFQYLDENGETRCIESGDVNDYLREITGEEFTAKDFRTWSGTVLAAIALRELEKFDSQAQAKKNVVEAVKSVSERLGNTPSVCRKCYVHPAIFDSYLDGNLITALKEKAEDTLKNDVGELRPEEAAVLALLQQRLASEEKKRAA